MIKRSLPLALTVVEGKLKSCPDDCHQVECKDSKTEQQWLEQQPPLVEPVVNAEVLVVDHRVHVLFVDLNRRLAEEIQRAERLTLCDCYVVEWHIDLAKRVSLVEFLPRYRRLRTAVQRAHCNPRPTRRRNCGRSSTQGHIHLRSPRRRRGDIW